jgi:cytochrome c biogenesis protein CcmG/thiol:disulfide interchange protein DsbE
MSFRPATSRKFPLALGLLAAALLAACGSSGGDPGAGNLQSQASDYRKALADAPPALAKLYADGDALIPGGKEALDQQLASVRGHAAVVNVWASWCGPCRLEIPDFQKVAAERGDEVAFIGINAEDSDAAAETFLDEFPLPYPSVTDPNSELKDEFGLRGYPATAFYNSDGERVYVKQGPYTSEEELNADIDKYAS